MPFPQICVLLHLWLNLKHISRTFIVVAVSSAILEHGPGDKHMAVVDYSGLHTHLVVALVIALW